LLEPSIDLLCLRLLVLLLLSLIPSRHCVWVEFSGIVRISGFSLTLAIASLDDRPRVRGVRAVGIELPCPKVAAIGSVNLAWNRNGTESSAKDGTGESAEYSPAAKRRERIIKLRLANEVRRSSLEQLRRNTITVAECVETVDRIKAALGNELLRLPASLSHELANREPQYIQKVLDAAFRSALERLSRLENYLYSNF